MLALDLSSPKTPVRRAQCVRGPHPSVRDDSWRGGVRRWELKMDPATTHADHLANGQAFERAASEPAARTTQPLVAAAPRF